MRVWGLPLNASNKKKSRKCTRLFFLVNIDAHLPGLWSGSAANGHQLHESIQVDLVLDESCGFDERKRYQRSVRIRHTRKTQEEESCESAFRVCSCQFVADFPFGVNRADRTRSRPTNRIGSLPDGFLPSDDVAANPVRAPITYGSSDRERPRRLPSSTPTRSGARGSCSRSTRRSLRGSSRRRLRREARSRAAR